MYTGFRGLRMGNGNMAPLTSSGAIDMNALVGGMVDRAKAYKYDTLKLAPGATVASQYSFLQVPVNSPDPYNGNIVKTLVETNMKTAAQQGFSAPEDMVLYNLGFLFMWDGRLLDIINIIKMSYFQFKIYDKMMWEGSLARNPSGMGITGYSTQTSESAWNNGTAHPQAVWTFGDYGKYIAPGVPFSLTLYFPETMTSYFNANIPANVTAANLTTSGLPQLISSTTYGGNGLQCVALMNGLTDRAVN